MCGFRKMSETPPWIAIVLIRKPGSPRLNFIEFLPNLEFPELWGRGGGYSVEKCRSSMGLLLSTPVDAGCFRSYHVGV